MTIPYLPQAARPAESTINRRRWLRRAALSAASLAGAGAQAQTPPLRMLVGYPAGSTVDISARLLAEPLRSSLGRSVVVDNRVGAASRIAMEALRAARPDGHTVCLVAHGPLTLFPHIHSDLRYDPVRDFTPISRVNASDYCISAGPLAAVGNLDQLRRWAADPSRKAGFGTPGAGSVPHFIGTALADKAGIAWQHVPYKGSPPAIQDVLAGQLACAVTPLMDALDKHQGGQLRILATTGARRSPLLPAVPTLRELGIDLQVSAWTALYAPAGLSAAQTQQLHRATEEALGSAALREKFAAMGFSAEPSSPQALAQLQREESQMWAAVVRASGFTPGS